MADVVKLKFFLRRPGSPNIIPEGTRRIDVERDTANSYSKLIVSYCDLCTVVG